jgi:uncharacterized protein (DUF1015 family)
MNINRFEPYGIAAPQILVPAQHIDLKAWAVVACDQYTQEKDYWERAEKIREGKLSALSLILPEVYLTEKDSRVPRIHEAMNEYARGGVFADPFEGMVYVERRTAYGRTRRGLVAAIDLDAYDWRAGATALIRATEHTIVERIPARMDIRKNAPLEVQHIMLLANDPHKHLVEGAGRVVSSRALKPLYDTDLMLDAGHITGYALCGDALDGVERSLETLMRQNAQKDSSVFLFAAGDGNHSLASAKAVWEALKQGGVRLDHPARFALVEIVNIYDDGLTFEPIHRVVFNAAPRDLTAFMASRFGTKVLPCPAPQEMLLRVEHSAHTIGFAERGDSRGLVCACVDAPPAGLAVSALQPALDEYLATHKECSVDYIHGTEELLCLASQNDTIAIVMPPIEKNNFFSTIAQTGVLPRKSFSMGAASEKRFYLECRKLF